MINATLDDFLMVEEFESINLIDTAISWVLDSGASLHVTFRRYLFTSYIPGDFGYMKMTYKGVAKCASVGRFA